MNQVIETGSSELPFQYFEPFTRQRAAPSPSLNAIAIFAPRADGGSVLFATEILAPVVIVGLLSASTAAINGLESLRWFRPSGEVLRHEALQPALAATPTLVRSDVDVKLEQYRSIEDGWLHERALAPGIDAVDRAVKLNKMACAGGWPPTRSYVSGDGEVGLVWDNANGYADVGFWSDGSLVFYVKTADEELRDDVEAAVGLPDTLLELLRSLIA